MANIFSPIQHKVLVTLGNKSMKLADLAEKVYADAVPKPLSPRTAVRSAIEFINYKCEMKGLDWKLKTEGMGRNGATVKKVKHQWD